MPKLYLNGKLIWSNPDDIGWVGIKARKQALEQRICERIDRERAAVRPCCGRPDDQCDCEPKSPNGLVM